ncbi:putative receptor-like protein kinase At5g39000 isoform X3 [Primulina huaijiensis]
MKDCSLPGAYSIALLLFMRFFIAFTDCIDDPAAYITGDVSINCGSAAVSAAHSGRKWIGDKHPKFSSSLQLNGTSTISSVIRVDSNSDYHIPYKTARISCSAFSYTFLLSPGQKFIRLHFNPTAYEGFKRRKDLFNVVAGPYTLLGNFSASLTVDALGLSYFTKEYCLNVEENQLLSIIFSPATSQSRDVYAFINGIEINPVTLGHSCFNDGGTGARVIGHESQLFYIDNDTAIEKVHREKVRRDSAPSGDDFIGIFGSRETVLKEKASVMTWKIPVDVGFRYLVRLQFSNRGYKMMEYGLPILKVLINEVVAFTNIDIFQEMDNIVFLKHDHIDFLVIMRGRKEEGKRPLSLRSCDEFNDGRVPFTEFEIFKLSNFDNSLAFPNPLPSTLDSPSWNIQSLLSIITRRNIIATVTVFIVSVVNILVHKLRGILESKNTEEENRPSARAERFCRRFSLSDIQLGTGNFSDAHLIGKGGFGKVYKCLIDNWNETVAVKRLKPNSRQGAREFLAEIEALSDLRHINLVALIGYCNEHNEMILVYEYMPNGTLADHLYKLERNGPSCSSLTWKQRLDICIGAGRGLDYLHTGNAVIHRDVKVSNILLDENFMAKISDFGLVKHENRSNPQSHVSTKVRGTFGYFDPNYFSTGKLTRKSDVYAFGVVMLEVLCGRPALDQCVLMDERILTKWAGDKISKGQVDLIVASSLRGEILPDSLKTFVQLVERCLDDEPKKRPTMAQVVLQLECALEQQKTAICSVANEITSVSPRVDDTNFIGSEQLSISPTYGQTVASPKGQSKGNMDSAYPSSGENQRKASAYKPSWWPWNATWNRFKFGKKNELTIPGTAGLRKAVDALDKLGSNMTNLKPGGGPAARMRIKRNQIAVLAFEVANTIDKGANLMHSISEENIKHLKEVVLQSEGVNQLIAKDMDELLRIVAYDKRDELKVFFDGVARFGNLSWDPRWHNLDRRFKMMATTPPLKRLKEKVGTEIQPLMTAVQYTAELYHELNVLCRLEDPGFKDFSNSGQRGETLSDLRPELKRRWKHVQGLKKKSLWYKTLEEVMEKLVDTVHFLHLEIHSVFGRHDWDEPLKNSHQKLGSAGLALHYANIITQIDTLVSRPHSLPADIRDALYQGLPPAIKSVLRSRIQWFHLEEELTVTQIKAEMEKILQWLVPMATNTKKAHLRFGWVGEWANTRSELNRNSTGQTDLLRIETLHHANKKKTEAYILDLVVWLHHLITQPMAATRVGSSNNQRFIHKTNKSNLELTVEDQEMLQDVSKRKLTPGISKSQEFDMTTKRLYKQHRLTKSRSHSLTFENKEDPFPVKRRPSSIPIIDFDIDRIKALDVIDRVNTEWYDLEHSMDEA